MLLMNGQFTKESGEVYDIILAEKYYPDNYLNAIKISKMILNNENNTIYHLEDYWFAEEKLLYILLKNYVINISI